MFAAVRGLLGIKGVLPLLAAAYALGAASLYFTPYFGMRDTVARLAPYKAGFDAVGDAFEESEQIRKEEGTQAVEAVTEERESIASRDAAVDAALARAIARLDEEQTYDPDGCPVRRIIPLSELLGDETPGGSATGAGETGPADLRRPRD